MLDRTAVSLALFTALSCAALSCAASPYEPERDRKIPEPSKSVIWTHEQIIDASPERVWSIYVDFASYPEWNPFILEAVPREPAGAGADVGADVGVGSVVDIEVQLGSKTREMWHKVYAFQAPSDSAPGRFCWRDGGAATAFAMGSRCRTLTANPDGSTTFTQELVVGGVARGTAQRKYGEALAKALEDETAALAARVQGESGGVRDSRPWTTSSSPG